MNTLIRQTKIIPMISFNQSKNFQRLLSLTMPLRRQVLPLEGEDLGGGCALARQKQRSFALALNFWFFWFKPKEHTRKCLAIL
jgi:hypothetical protein